MASLKALALIPVFNEESHIGRLLDRFPWSECSAVVIDDASTDGTTRIIQGYDVPVLLHSGRLGVGKCLQDGITYALAHGADVIVVLAGNGKDDPAEIPKLLSEINAGADYVQGSRFLKGGEWRNLPWKRWLAIKAFTFVWNVLLAKQLTDITNGFRAYRTSFLNRPAVRWQQEWLQTYEFEYYLQYRALTLGISFKEIPVTKNYPTRINYSKVRPGMDWWRIVKPLLLLRFGFRS